MPDSIIEKCCSLLVEKNLTLAFAESASGGRLCAEFAFVPDSGKTLLGSLVAYDGNIKQDILGISKEMLDNFTPESAEVTEAMALGLRSVMKADIIVANTGLTTPGGSESEDKPVGTMFIHFLIKDEAFSFRKVYSGSSAEIVLKTAHDVAFFLVEQIKKL